ncbi:MAG: terminase small subunit [Acidovorax sp.]|nr:terminase small subunit [Acidovorax sp.]
MAPKKVAKAARSTKKTSSATQKAAAATARVDGLLPKQAKFVAEYLISGNATQAALAAGYSPKTAYKIGAENLKKPQIASLLEAKQSEIAARQDERLAAMELTQARVQREIARIAFFDPRKMFHADGRPKDVTELDDDTAACIVGLDVLEEWAGTGEDRVLVGHVKKYKIANKNAALDQAAKILGLYEKDNTQKVDPLAELLKAITSGGNSSFKPVADDPEHEKGRS